MIRNLVTRTLVVTAIAAGGFALSGTASAADNADSGGMGGCPVVNTDSSGKETTTYVPHGTKLMGLTCKDGTWVFVKAAGGGTRVTGGAVLNRQAALQP